MTKVKKFYIKSELVFEEKPNNCRFQHLEGQCFDRLIILGYAGKYHWFCKCDCGKITKVQSGHLKNRSTTSCGCAQADFVKERMATHGHSGKYNRTKTYVTWCSMMARCMNSNAPNFTDYGGRGITVCDRWLKFENFLDDMGERPENTTIDRIWSDGNYEPSNCRWATIEEQANNKRNNHLLTFLGKTQTIARWADEIGVRPGTLSARLYKGWSVEKALSEPVVCT